MSYNFRGGDHANPNPTTYNSFDGTHFTTTWTGWYEHATGHHCQFCELLLTISIHFKHSQHVTCKHIAYKSILKHLRCHTHKYKMPQWRKTCRRCYKYMLYTDRQATYSFSFLRILHVQINGHDAHCVSRV